MSQNNDDIAMTAAMNKAQAEKSKAPTSTKGKAKPTAPQAPRQMPQAQARQVVTLATAERICPNEAVACKISTAYGLEAVDFHAIRETTEEVLARVTALIRRSTGHDRASLTLENLVVDLAAQSASTDGQLLDLTGKEFKLLRFLVLRAGSVLDKQQVLNALYTSEDEPDDRIVGVYLCTLRRKLRDAGARITISTMRGLGYILRPGLDAEAPAPAIRIPAAARLGVAARMPFEHALA